MVNTARTGENIRLIRQAAGIKLRQMADDLDISHSRLSRYENGQVRIPDEVIEEIADYLDVYVEDLREGIA